MRSRSRLPRNRATPVTLDYDGGSRDHGDHRERGAPTALPGGKALLTLHARRSTITSSPSRAMLGLLGMRIFEATSANITDLVEEHGHRVLRVCGKGSKVLQVPLPPAVSRAIDRARTNLDRHPNYILAAYMSSAT